MANLVIFFAATNFSPLRLFYLYVVDIEVSYLPLGVLANTVSAPRPFFAHEQARLVGRVGVHHDFPLCFSFSTCLFPHQIPDVFQRFLEGLTLVLDLPYGTIKFIRRCVKHERY